MSEHTTELGPVWVEDVYVDEWYEVVENDNPLLIVSSGPDGFLFPEQAVFPLPSPAEE